MTRVGNLFFLFLCRPGMVPNQRQLSIVVSDWGSYLASLFPTCFWWDLVFVKLPVSSPECHILFASVLFLVSCISIKHVEL